MSDEKSIPSALTQISNSISPETFFSSFISKRLPVKIDGHILDPTYTANTKWTNDYLRRHIGDTVVKVEVRKDAKDRFGRGNEIKMQFREFLDKIESSNSNYYLTTQDLEYSIDGQPSIISPPLNDKILRDDYPLNPQLMGKLVVQNVNMWFGTTKEPSTSGLHHDFHDNLYLVVRGQKTFRLFPPMEYANMYTVGEIVRVHPNGRINYKGQLTRADGAAVSADAAMDAARALDKVAAKLDDGNDDSDIEDEVNKALEAALDAEIEEQSDYDDNDEDEPGEEEEEEEEQEEGEDSDDNDEEGDKPLTGEDANYMVVKSSQDHSSGKNQRSFDHSHDSETHKSKRQRPNESSEDATVKTDPPSNFSRVPTDASIEELKKNYPLYINALKHSIEVTINAGEMLYLPAGWFHEVFSKSSSDGHMALNYWFHPPDSDEFNRPYTSSFWESDWQARVKSGFI